MLGPPQTSTPLQTAVGTYFHVQHSTKSNPVFLPADEETSWLLPRLVSLLSGDKA